MICAAACIMATVIEDYIQQLHDDVYGALTSDPGLRYVPVYQSRTPLQVDAEGAPIVGQTEMIDEMIQQGLSGLEKYVARTPGQSEEDWRAACAADGKAGIACVVMLPDVKGESVNSVAPAMKLMQRVRVIENRLVNESASGTGITASKLCLHIVQLLGRRAFRGGNALYSDLGKMVEELALPGDERAHECVFIQHLSPAALAKVVDPTVSAAAGEITLACATAGAAIYYTLDGGFPGSGNPAALLYAEPFTLAPGTHRLRFAAAHADMQASNDLVAELTVS